jgi:hypothetical protein
MAISALWALPVILLFAWECLILTRLYRVESELQSVSMDLQMGGSTSTVPISYDCHIMLSSMYEMISRHSLDPVKVVEVIDKSAMCDVYSDLSAIRSSIRQMIGFTTLEAIRTHGTGPAGTRATCLALADHIWWLRGILAKRFDATSKHRKRPRLDCSNLSPGLPL